MARSRKKSFIIDRQVWFRGSAYDNSKTASSQLWTGEKGRSMCCLGQIAQQCGVNKRQLRDAGSPLNLSDITLEKLPQWMQPTINNDNAMIRLFINSNDNSIVDDKSREKELHKLAKQAGIRLTFIN